jgi:hypothetical protein
MGGDPLLQILQGFHGLYPMLQVSSFLAKTPTVESLPSLPWRLSLQQMMSIRCEE